MEGLPGARKCFKYKFIDEGSGDACAEGKNKTAKTAKSAVNTGDAVSQAKKRALRSTANPVSRKVLNQGGHGTCVAYAFSLVMTTGLQEKYGIACDPEKFVEKVKALCPCWEGHDTERMVEEWNEKHATAGAAVEDVDQRQRYNVKVEYSKISSFEEARAEMERQEALRLVMPCTISTDEQGHELHAVALRSTVPGGTMEAVNSWGAKESLLCVTMANFFYAIRFDPLITAATKSGDIPLEIPKVRENFQKREQQHADKRAAAEVAQQKRQQAEEAAQQAAAKAKRLQEQLKLLQAQTQSLEKSQPAKRKREEHEARRSLKKKENTGKARSKNSFDAVEKGGYGVTRCSKCKWEIWGCQC
jgi:hypothetical protein